VSAPSCFGRYVKPLVPATFAGVSTHQPVLGPLGGLWPFSLFVIHRKGLYPSSGGINRLMMMMMMSAEGGEAAAWAAWSGERAAAASTAQARARLAEGAHFCASLHALLTLLDLDHINAKT
jgi:hypothetical protein